MNGIVKRITAILLLCFLVSGICFAFVGRVGNDPDSRQESETQQIHKANAELHGLKRVVNVAATAITNLEDAMKKASSPLEVTNNRLTQGLYELCGAVYRVLPKRFIEDAEKNTVLLNNGYFAFSESHDLEQAERSCKRIAAFSQKLEQQGIPFLFVITTGKEYEAAAQFPKGLYNNYRETEQLFINRLAEYDVPCVVGREQLLANGSSLFDWFYRTDHHWNVHAGRLIAQTIARRLQSQYGLTVDPAGLDESNFTSKVYPGSFLGSQGRKATLGYTEAEDFEVLYPVEKTDFTVQLPDLGEVYNGAFENTVLDDENFHGHIYGGGEYGVFLYGDQSLIRVENHLADNETTVLVVKHSQANVVNTYLSFAVRHMDTVDPRHYSLTHQNSIYDMILTERPDAVVCLIGVSDDYGWMGTAS